nr:MAG TPA: ATP:corrinoid adenosyltransferase [Caudoviricetes sp.]
MSEFPREIYRKELVAGDFDTPKGNYKAKRLLQSLFEEGLKVDSGISVTHILLSNTSIFIHFYLGNGLGKTTSVLNLYKNSMEFYSLKELRNILMHLSSAYKTTRPKAYLSEVDFVRHVLDKYDMGLIQLALRFDQKELI